MQVEATGLGFHRIQKSTNNCLLDVDVSNCKENVSVTSTTYHFRKQKAAEVLPPIDWLYYSLKMELARLYDFPTTTIYRNHHLGLGQLKVKVVLC